MRIDSPSRIPPSPAVLAARPGGRGLRLGSLAAATALALSAALPTAGSAQTEAAPGERAAERASRPAALARTGPGVFPPPTADGAGVVVAPPAGEGEPDGASLLAARERVRPGGTLPFAAEGYRAGEPVRVEARPASDRVGDPGTGDQATRSADPQIDTRMVEVDGLPMRVQTAGLRNRARGQPIIVLENGAGTPLEVWAPVLAGLAEFAPLVAYDRSGIGRSAWDEQPPTPPHVNRKLRDLLAAIGAEPPYVLVGYSWGGPLVRSFAGTWPDEVAGLVFIDAPDLMRRRHTELAALREIGAGDGARSAFYRSFDELVANAPPGIRAEMRVIEELLEKDGAELAALRTPQVPVAVLVAGRYDPLPPSIRLPFDERAFWEAELRHRVRELGESLLGEPEATLTLATHARHQIHGDDPALVIEAIRRVSFPDVTRQLRRILSANGPAAAVEHYLQIKRRYPAERFHENLLNAIGYELLQGGDTGGAIAVFELNVREYPQVANPHDSLGDGYGAAGRWAEARASYQRAVRLAESGGDPRLPRFRAKLERVEQMHPE
jgi:pimeloyl-ACP methyl ester carboxylesterase